MLVPDNFFSRWNVLIVKNYGKCLGMGIKANEYLQELKGKLSATNWCRCHWHICNKLVTLIDIFHMHNKWTTFILKFFPFLFCSDRSNIQIRSNWPLEVSDVPEKSYMCNSLHMYSKVVRAVFYLLWNCIKYCLLSAKSILVNFKIADPC